MIVSGNKLISLIAVTVRSKHKSFDFSKLFNVSTDSKEGAKKLKGTTKGEVKPKESKDLKLFNMSTDSKDAAKKLKGTTKAKAKTKESENLKLFNMSTDSKDAAKKLKGTTKAKAKTKESENLTSSEFEFFYGKESVFSQFHPAKFEVDGVKYNCMEQYMHHQKAVVFKDEAMAKQIMETSDPLTHKRLGRKVSNFDPKVWSVKSIEIVKKGNVQKFKQNPLMLPKLLKTYPKTLVEAAPRDRLWGIGLSAKNPKALNRSTWRGKNLLGECLTEVREILMKEMKKGDKDSEKDSK